MQSLKNLLHKGIGSTITSSNNGLANSNRVSLDAFWNTLPSKDGTIYISDERFFQHEEEAYDDQYSNDPATTSVGVGVINLLNAFNCNFDGAAIEIGCGTGIVSRGMLTADHQFRSIIISDPSPKFVNITRRKLQDIQELDQKAKFAILLAEDVSKLPPDGVAAIVMRSVLHHVVDVKTFLLDASAALEPGGILVVEEPCAEGFILMATFAQFIPKILEKEGYNLNSHQHEQIENFIHTMRFYTNRVVDKSNSEDKHVFRVDELMKDAEQADLKTDFYPNFTFSDFASNKAKAFIRKTKQKPFSFSVFFYNYLKYCMQFDAELLEMISNHFLDYCSLIDKISAKGNAPHSVGVFLFKKRGGRRNKINQ